MVREAVRTHIVFPRDVIEAIDRVAGSRKRSEFITEAVRDKLIRELQKRALEETFGALADADYPEWETPEKTSAWVRELRAADQRRTDAKWADRSAE